MNISVSPKKSANADKKIELLVIGVFQDELRYLNALVTGKPARKKIEEILGKKKFSGKSAQTHLVCCSQAEIPGAYLLVGLGLREDFVLQDARLLAAKAVAEAKRLGYSSIAIDLEAVIEKFSAVEIAQAVSEGAILADYSFDKYKSKNPTRVVLENLVLLIKDPAVVSALRSAVRTAEIIGEAVYFTRNLANEPGNVMTPPHLASLVKSMAAKNNLKCRVLGKSEIQRLKMGGILAVSQGSLYPPQLIELENRVTSKLPPIVLVGKGITFDSGGISIKPSNDMDKMKFDMCGAAAVIGVMKAVANLKLPIRVVALMPVCENMPGSAAQRPGDIIRFYNKKTAEVLNTDAEGRLILADALAYAEKFNPRVLIDVATLTGACAVTFADIATGLMSTDEDLAKKIREAGELSGERCWELPLWKEYGELIKATYADIQNISKRYAGTITAGLFLKEFADHTKSWAHLDIAGTAYNESGPKPLSPIGATGVGVRLLIRVLQKFAK